MARMPKVPKVREYVELTLGDGKALKGYVFIDATSRIQELLNTDHPFIAFVDEAENIHLLNKDWIKIVRPFDGCTETTQKTSTDPRECLHGE
jgi:hypothetical protein